MTNRKAIVSCRGDRSVGIPGTTAVIELGFMFEDEYDNGEHREFVRERLRECFAEIWDDGSTTVWFDDEEPYTGV